MERLMLISIASAVIVALVLWGSYTFYVDYTFKRSCADLKSGFETSIEAVEVSPAVRGILRGMSGGAGCNIFSYLVKIDQAKFVVGSEKEKALAQASEISGMAESLRRIEHIAIPKSCGVEGVLQRYEKDYCAAVHEENYKLIKAIESGGLEEAYRATLINCLGECINESPRCAQACWDRKTKGS